VLNSKEVTVGIQHEILEYTLTNSTLTIPTTFTVSGTVGNDEELFSIHFSLLVKYDLPSDADFAPQYLEFFAENNVPANVWPYARELVSSMTSRMGLPPFTLPILKVV